MRILVQRVREASVTVEGRITGQIGPGFLVFLGISREDGPPQAERLSKKLLGLRIFPDEEGKTNLSLQDVGGQLLLVSQFTLYADCSKGYRPSFFQAAGGPEAEALYEYFIALCRAGCPVVQTGVFGAHMEVALINDGPFTIFWEENP